MSGRPKLPSGLVTFMFTDIEGSTRLLRSLGTERYAAALEEHRALLVSMQESMDVMQKRMGAYTSLASLETPTNGGGQ